MWTRTAEFLRLSGLAGTGGAPRRRRRRPRHKAWRPPIYGCIACARDDGCQRADLGGRRVRRWLSEAARLAEMSAPAAHLGSHARVAGSLVGRFTLAHHVAPSFAANRLRFVGRRCSTTQGRPRRYSPFKMCDGTGRFKVTAEDMWVMEKMTK